MKTIQLLTLTALISACGGNADRVDGDRLTQSSSITIPGPLFPQIPPARPGELAPDEGIYAGDAVTSTDGRFRFAYQTDGHLVLYQGAEPLWWSGTAGTLPGWAVMQGDGNFVVYDGNAQPVFNTGTSGNPGAYLRVQNDGNVVVYSPHGGALWSSGTCCR